MTKYIIRTSDRKKFKECRQAWDLGSKIRQDLDPIAVRTPLDFGTEIHAGLEVWYDPKLWKGTPIARRPLALLAFHRTWQKHRTLYEKYNVLSQEAMDDMKERKVLGEAMLDYYFKWSKERDKNLTPVYTEVEFEVPIRIPTSGIALPPEFGLNVATDPPSLTFRGYPVVYQGRIDLIVQDSDDHYWLVDHKTAGPRAWAEESNEFLIRDEQCKSYAWAIQHVLGINVRGVIYNELYKGTPQEPARLQRTRKGLSFSTSKQQDTTFEIALETFKREDREALKAGWYDEYLTFLKNEGKQFVRRNRVTYTPDMLTILGDQICMEAIDMLADPFIYPNPGKFNCRWCDFRTPCEALLDGQPIDWMKDTMYVKRSEQKEVTSR